MRNTLVPEQTFFEQFFTSRPGFRTSFCPEKMDFGGQLKNFNDRTREPMGLGVEIITLECVPISTVWRKINAKLTGRVPLDNNCNFG
jgi:hypothetical protein